MPQVSVGGDSRLVSERFRAAWTGADDDTATPELLPMRLAQAVVATLPATAAGISLFDHEFRVPLGASDNTAAAAERMQFTHGSGPCLEAAAHQAALHVTMEEMRERWPTFAADLERHSPYRAILSLPLHVSRTISGAVDLYFREPDDVTRLPLTDVLTVVSQVTDAMVAAQATPAPGAGLQIDETHPAWLFSTSARDRTQVWIALGMVMTTGDLDARDALSVLRAFAYGRDQVLDDVARDLIEGRVSADQVASAS